MIATQCEFENPNILWNHLCLHGPGSWGRGEKPMARPPAWTYRIPLDSFLRGLIENGLEGASRGVFVLVVVPSAPSFRSLSSAPAPLVEETPAMMRVNSDCARRSALTTALVTLVVLIDAP